MGGFDDEEGTSQGFSPRTTVNPPPRLHHLWLSCTHSRHPLSNSLNVPGHSRDKRRDIEKIDRLLPLTQIASGTEARFCRLPQHPWYFSLPFSPLISLSLPPPIPPPPPLSLFSSTHPPPALHFPMMKSTSACSCTTSPAATYEHARSLVWALRGRYWTCALSHLWAPVDLHKQTRAPRIYGAAMCASSRSLSPALFSHRWVRVCVCVCVCVYVYALFLPVITSGGCCSEREEEGDKVVDGWGGREAKEGDGGASDR